jgi:hypothetical protein
MMAVLPDGLDDDQRCLGRDRLEHLDPGALAIDEAMAGQGVDVV